MKRQTIMQTYKELLSVKNDTRWVSAEPAKKLYWVGTDPVTGIMKLSCDFHDILGHDLDNVREVWAQNSAAAGVEYNASIIEL